MPRHPHILNAASNLLGIALVIITGLNLSHIARLTLADEIAWIAAIFLSLSCLLSYLAVRAGREDTLPARLADGVFLCGMVTLFVSVIVLAVALH